jgi:glucuronate isomerase
MLVVFGEMDWETGWTQQFHYGAIRNNNTKMFKLLGPDTGFDSIGEFTTAKSMAKYLDRLNSEGKLTKTILYNLNPCANEVIATMLGNFQDGSIPGKIQFGSGWWFLDQKDGMEKQMNALSLLGLLSRFVGMLTDSRSFLSYPLDEIPTSLQKEFIQAEDKNFYYHLGVDFVSIIRAAIQNKKAGRVVSGASTTTCNYNSKSKK